MDIPNNVINPQLYRIAKKDADQRFKRPTSAYKSMYISKKYQELGGKYKGKKDPKKGTVRWSKGERWIQVVPYLTKGEIIECGANNRKGKACRPLVRVNKNTPITLSEVVDKHGKEKVLELARKKQRDMDSRIYWKTGKFIPSKNSN